MEFKLTSYLFKEGEETQIFENVFKTLKELKQYIKDCGGIKAFKFKGYDDFSGKHYKSIYFITKKINDKIYYYEFKFGKYHWVDENGHIEKI